MTKHLSQQSMGGFTFSDADEQQIPDSGNIKNQNTGANLGFEEKLWLVADKMRGHMDPAEYKHIALGLIFLKYIYDNFQENHRELQSLGLDAENPALYKNAHIFWIPSCARWPELQCNTKSSLIGKVINEAMLAIEQENESLQDILPKEYARPTINKRQLGELVEIIGTIGLGSKEAQSKDVIGRVYEYFLLRFAGTEGNKGGEFYTPRSVVRLLVEMVEPYNGSVYDPCCGSAGMFVQSEEFIREHGGRTEDVRLFGQESNPTTWRLAKMNMASRNMRADLGPHHADTFTEDLHPDLEADYILANPPFNMSYWGSDRLQKDARWSFGVPPDSSANFAWVQHMLAHLAPNGVAGFVLSNGTLSSNTAGEGKLRQCIIEADLVDCIVSLPSQLFYGTSISASLWFLAKNKNRPQCKPHCGQTLFIDARNMGNLVDRTHRELFHSEIMRIAQTYRSWRGSHTEVPYYDVPGFCKSATIADIGKHKWALVPGRYVGFSSNPQSEQNVDHLLREIEEVEERLQKVSDASKTALDVLKGFLHGCSTP